MAKSTSIYKITILNWETYNKKAKKGHPCIMLSKDFLDDVKIKRLPSGGKLLYLWFLLRRGDVKTTFGGPSGEVDTTFIEASHEDLVRYAGGSGQVVVRLLDQLQSFQLVTWENISPLYNIKEEKLKEEKLKEYNKSEIPKPEKQSSPKNKKSPSPFYNELENVYQNSYPRKEGKQKGLEKLNSEIKTEAELILFTTAVLNYRKKVELEHTELKFIKMFSSFASCWREYTVMQANQVHAVTNRKPAPNKAQQVFDTARAQLEAIERGEL